MLCSVVFQPFLCPRCVRNMSTYTFDEITALQHPPWQWDDEYDHAVNWRLWLGYQPPPFPIQFLLLVDDDEQATVSSLRLQAIAQSLETDEPCEELAWRLVANAHDSWPLQSFGVISVYCAKWPSQQNPVEATVLVLRGARDKLITRNPWLETFALTSMFHSSDNNLSIVV